MRRLFMLHSRTLIACCIGVAVLLLCPARAEAHLNSTGLGPAYDGLLHFFLSPEDLLPVLALSLFAGQRGTPFGRWALFLVPGAWILGGWVGIGHNVSTGALVPICSFLLAGGLLAADAKLSFNSFAIIVVAFGISHGYFNGAGLGRVDHLGIVMSGIVAAVFVFVGLSASFSVSIKEQWARIALRVVGSWTVACGILLAGWSARR